ncbi:MAG: hypothetical protein GXW99_05285 [Clostridiales bacterium]|nr:hypothetical protein [Clostridiales bacterium]
MPRTKLSAQSDAQRDMTRLLRHGCQDVKGSIKQSASAFGMSNITLGRRIKDPGTFTLAELKTARRVLQLSKDELVECISRML